MHLLNIETRPQIFPIDLKNYILPDGTKPENESVFGEGILKEFVRRIGVVFATLDPLPFDGSADGRVLF